MSQKQAMNSWRHGLAGRATGFVSGGGSAQYSVGNAFGRFIAMKAALVTLGPLAVRRSSFQRAVAFSLALCLVPFMVSCRGMAKRELRALVDEERVHLDSSKALLSDSAAVGFLAPIADDILQAARALDGYEAVTERGAEQEGALKDVLDIHDEFAVYVVHDAAPNAWVMGDDFACITTSAFLLAEDPAELAFVLAHEFGHLRESHSVEVIERRYANEFAAGMAAGLAGAAAGYNSVNNPYYSQAQYQADMNNAVLLGQAILASFSPHRKEDEHESDAQAVDLLVAAGYPINNATGFLEKMLTLYGADGGDSHPRTDERIARIKEKVGLLQGYEPSVSLDLAAFQRAQESIRVETLELVEQESLQHYSAERLGSDRSMIPIKSCGAVDASQEAVISLYVKLVTQGR